MNPVSKFTPKIRREKTLSNPELSKQKDSVQVFCRIRPLKDQQQSTCLKLLSASTLSLTTPPESRGIQKEVHCNFKHIFTAYAMQNEVFDHVAFPLLEDLLTGRNGLLFTYGVTGSGKTFTLSGTRENPGIMPRCIHTIFNSIDDYQAPKFVIKSDRMNGFEVQSNDEAMQDKLNEIRTTTKTPKRRVNKDKSFRNDGGKLVEINKYNLYSVFVSYIEIYNNTVYDLLDESSGKTVQGKILREGAYRNMYVNGVVEAEVKSAEEAFELFNIGQKRKRMGNTILNSVSSRSHSIFNIRIVQFQQRTFNEAGVETVPDMNLLKVSQLSLVDLAGSERTSRTQNTGAQLKEASQINNSLLSLRTCLEILRENHLTGGGKLVPYRDSRLTFLFKNYFEGEGRIAMVVCINPSVDDFEENLQVVKFAERTQDVKVARAEPRYTPCKKTITKKTHTPHVFKATVLGPKLPDICLKSMSTAEATIAIGRLINVLKAGRSKVRTYKTDMSQQQASLRKRLDAMQQENILTVSELKSSKTQLKKEKQRSANLECKLQDSEVKLEDLAMANQQLRDEIDSLRNVVSEKDRKINKNILEREKVKQKLALQNERMTHELDVKLRRQREHYAETVQAKDQKLRQLKHILNSDEVIRQVEQDENVNPARLELPKEISNTPRRQPGTPAVRKRRSKSAGDVWLEHNSIKPVALATVLQPTMKKRKSVTKLSKASEITNPKQSKYCLIAQEQDTDGDVETRLYKGDIVPTCGGGAQVIFNDVEKLRQESPTKL